MSVLMMVGSNVQVVVGVEPSDELFLRTDLSLE